MVARRTDPGVLGARVFDVEFAVPRHVDTSTGNAAADHSQSSPLDVLIVARHTAERRQIAGVIQGSQLHIHLARNIAEAHRRMGNTSPALVIIDHQLSDGPGMDFVRAVHTRSPDTQVILLAETLSAADTIEAMRAGASDVVIKPLVDRELVDRIRQAVERNQSSRKQQSRIDRLRRVCRKLNEARLEVSEQVNVLCNDLVAAYQDLADQMNCATQITEYTAMVRHELELEVVVRRTLEYLLQKVGPTNAAIFLPSNADEYTLGGYVNYDCTSDGAQLLLDHLADVIAPRLAATNDVQHVRDNDTLTAMFGDDAAYLADSHLVGIACEHEEETLAVITLFRDADQPYSQLAVDTLHAVGPLLAAHLTRIIRIHHRHVPLFGDE